MLPDLYFLDSSVLIQAQNECYPFERVPQYWEWLLIHAKAGAIKIPPGIHDEIKAGGKDQLLVWVNQHKSALLLDEEADAGLVASVLSQGYHFEPNETELAAMRADPFLIAHALADKSGRTVVTREKRKPSRLQGRYRKIPDVCDELGVKCCTPWELNSLLDFRAR